MAKGLEGLDLADRLLKMSALAKERVGHLSTEEGTKFSLVVPFIEDVLGYDANDPTEVVPEYVADHGTKRGEKVDFAILRNGKPIMLIECKHVGTPLEDAASQLYRYFAVTSTSVGVLTDGIRYRFYSDIEARNRMDAKPFLDFGLDDLEEVDAEELKQFAKPHFDPDQIRRRARDLKFTRDILEVVKREWESPGDDFVRHFAGRVYEGVRTRSVIDELRPLTKQALRQFLNQRVRRRLRDILNSEEPDSNGGSGEEGATPELNVEQTTPSRVSRLIGLELWGEQYQIRIWNRLLLTVAEQCWRRNPDEFEASVVGWRGPSWIVVGRDPDRVKRPREIADSGIFISVNASASTCERWAREILTRCGHNPDDLRIILA